MSQRGKTCPEITIPSCQFLWTEHGSGEVYCICLVYSGYVVGTILTVYHKPECLCRIIIIGLATTIEYHGNVPKISGATSHLA